MLTEIADIYVRLSDQDRDKKKSTDESESIQNQKTMLINYCLEKGWQINGIYSDEDYSGADSKRPGWNAVLKDCEEKRCSIVVCKTQSRFSRDMEMIEKYIHGKFPEWGIRFVGVVDNADTSVKGNKKARQINGLVNEWYLEDLSENIKSTLSSKRKNGEFVGSFAPYGYIVDPEDKNHLIIDEVAAPVVKRIFNMYIEGRGYIGIAKALNDEKIPPPCVRKKELGLNYYNGNFEKNSNPEKVWSDASVYAILRRMEYTGALVQGRQEVVNYKTGKRRKKSEREWDIVENSHEPIITMEQFLKAKEVRLTRGRGQKIPSGKCYPLSRKVFCGECGNTMWKMSCALKDGRYNYLACRTRKTSNGVCDNNHNIRLDELEEIVINEINKLLDRYYDQSLIGKIPTPKKDKRNENSTLAEIEELEKKIKRNDERMAQMYTDKLDRLITTEQFMKYREAYEKESSLSEERICLLKQKLKEITGKTDFPDTKSVLDKYRHIDTLTFEIANEFIKKIYIGKKERNKKREIKIEWNI